MNLEPIKYLAFDARIPIDSTMTDEQVIELVRCGIGPVLLR